MHAKSQNSWIDRLLDHLFAWIDAPLVRQAAGEVVRECRAALWDCVYKPTRGMTRPQARGYIRAIAPAFANHEVDAVLSRRRLGSYLRSQVVAAATVQLAEVVADDVSVVQSSRTTKSRVARAA